VGILSDLENDRQRKRCKFGQYLDCLDPAILTEAEEALGNERWTSAQINRVLRPYGWDGAETGLARHRRKECVCDDL
jgi:hypothetical protein